MVNFYNKHTQKIGTHLLAADLCSESQLYSALGEQEELSARGEYLPLGQILLKNQILSQKSLNSVLQDVQLSAVFDLELFQEQTPGDLQQLLRKSEFLNFPDGNLLFREGDRADAYYVIVSGKVRIYRVSREGLEIDLNILGPGNGFGELGILHSCFRSTHACTVGPVHLIRISKPEFEEFMATHPEASSKLIKTVGSWLSKSDQTVVSSVCREKKYSQLLGESAANSYQELLHSSRLFRRIKDRINDLAGNNYPCFVIGEHGTEIMGAAFLVHKSSSRHQGPFLRYQPGNAREAGNRGSATKLGTEETNQTLELFGSETGPGSPCLGLLAAADQGTLVIENIESLGSSVQQQLADFLGSDLFYPCGSQFERFSTVRIIASSEHHPQTLLESGLLDQRLCSFFEPEALEISPLRKRKRDLKSLLQLLINIGNKRTGKNIQGVDQEAYQRIMAYDWPGNLEELEATILRAVNLASGETLGSRDLLFGLEPVQGQWTLDILQYKPLRRFMQTSLYPGLFQGVFGLVFLSLFFLSFLADEVGRRLALDLTWGVWEPMVVLSVFFLGRFWCAVCPLRGAAMFINKRLGLGFEVPGFIRDYSPYFCALGIGLIIWAEITWDIFSNATGTLLLLLVFVVLAMSSSLFFRKLVWCRFLCPLGALLGLFSRCSCTEMRANQGICNNDCIDHPCVGTSNNQGCPMLEAPFTISSNQNCILCAECLKICPEDSQSINLRIPGDELGRVRYPTSVMAVLVPAVMGTQFFRGMIGLKDFAHIGLIQTHWASCLFVLGLCTLLAFALVSLAGRQIFGPLLKGDLKKGWLLVYAFVPLVFAFELGYHLEILLTRGGWIVPGLGGLLGLQWKIPTFFFSQGAVLTVQNLLLLAACVWSIALVSSIAKNHQISGHGLKYFRYWPILAITLLLSVMLFFSSS